MGHGSLVQLHGPQRPAASMAARAHQKAHRQFRAGAAIAMAHRAGYSSAAMEPRDAAFSQQLALRDRLLCRAAGTDVGSKVGGTPETPPGELVTRVAPLEGYRLWSSHYDDTP